MIRHGHHGKGHFFGTVKVGERGQVVIPKEARELFSIEPGDKLHFIYQGILYRIPIRRESAAKWYDFLSLLVERRKAEIAEK